MFTEERQEAALKPDSSPMPSIVSTEALHFWVLAEWHGVRGEQKLTTVCCTSNTSPLVERWRLHIGWVLYALAAWRGLRENQGIVGNKAWNPNVLLSSLPLLPLANAIYWALWSTALEWVLGWRNGKLDWIDFCWEEHWVILDRK